MTYINPINLLLVPLAITVIVLGPHYLFKWLSYRREIKRDKKIKQEVDRLLQVDDDLQIWYKKEFS